MVNLKIPFYLETVHVDLIHCIKQIAMKSLALDPKAKFQPERNLDCRHAEPEGERIVAISLAPVLRPGALELGVLVEAAVEGPVL